MVTQKTTFSIIDDVKLRTRDLESVLALLYHVHPDVGPVYTVSISPTGSGAAGFTMPLPEKDEIFHKKGRMRQKIIVGLGGRAAEELVLDDITTGASQDIKVATKTARAMITRYGFSDEIGMVNYEQDENEVFIGRDWGHTKNISDNVANKIDEEVRSIIDECYKEAKKILIDNKDKLDACADLLIQKERITRDEFEALFDSNQQDKL